MHILFVLTSLRTPHLSDDPSRVIDALARALEGLGHRVTCMAPAGRDCPTLGTLVWLPDVPLEEQVPPGVDVVHVHGHTAKSIHCTALHTYWGPGIPGSPCPANTVFASKALADMHGGSAVVPPGFDWDAYGPLMLGKHRHYCHFLGDASSAVHNVRGAMEIAGKAGVRLHVIGGTRISLRPNWRFTLSPFVRFHGALHDEGRYALLNQSQALIQPVRWPEPVGLSAIESLFFGCPVIGTPMGALPEILRPEAEKNRPSEHPRLQVDAMYAEWGCLSFKKSDLVEAIRHVKAFDPFRSHDHARAFFSARKAAEAYEVLYQRVLRGEALHETPPPGIPVDQAADMVQLEA